MKKLPTWFLVGLLVISFLANSGCTETSLRQLLYVPVLNAAADEAISGLQDIMDSSMSDAVGDSSLMQAIGHGITTAVGDLASDLASNLIPAAE